MRTRIEDGVYSKYQQYEYSRKKRKNKKATLSVWINKINDAELTW